jgi:hypothetical protein
LDRTFALDAGWQETKAKNRWLLWIDNRWIGRMMWFMNGRVNLHVKSPVSLGRIKQLVCNGFGFTGIIFEDKILEKVLDSVRPTGAHYVFDVGQNLPKKTIDYFNKDLGVKIRIGDKSHPKSVEVELNTPDWVDRLSVAITRFSDLLAPQMMPPSKQSYFQEYVV